MGLPGPGDPTFTMKIEESCPCPQVLHGLGPRSEVQFFGGPNPTRFGCPAGVPTFVGMNRRNPASKPPGEELKVGLVGKFHLPGQVGVAHRAPAGPLLAHEGLIGQLSS